MFLFAVWPLVSLEQGVFTPSPHHFLFKYLFVKF